MQPVEAERGSGNIPEQGPRSMRLSSPLSNSLCGPSCTALCPGGTYTLEGAII